MHYTCSADNSYLHQHLFPSINYPARLSGAGSYIASCSSSYPARPSGAGSYIASRSSSSSSSSPSSLLLLSVNRSISHTCYVRFWPNLAQMTSTLTATRTLTMVGSKVTMGSLGSKRSFSPKLLFFVQITWYGHVTHICSSARYPLQKLLV